MTENRGVIDLGTKGDRILAGALGIALAVLGFAIFFPFEYR
jgi:hypothetical protein